MACLVERVYINITVYIHMYIFKGLRPTVTAGQGPIRAKLRRNRALDIGARRPDRGQQRWPNIGRRWAQHQPNIVPTQPNIGPSSAKPKPRQNHGFEHPSKRRKRGKKPMFLNSTENRASRPCLSPFAGHKGERRRERHFCDMRFDGSA